MPDITPDTLNLTPDVLIIGGGPAGMSVAIECARAGLVVTLVEQRPRLGGAIFRQPVNGVAPLALAAGPERLKARLFKDFAAQVARIHCVYGALFAGLDADGLAIVEDRQTSRVLPFRPRALVLATGAVEAVLPRPGWTLPGVTTAGGLQVLMKETGRAPQGRVVLAGSGPLLLALAAQLIRLGRPPLAVLEAGDPIRRPGASLALLAHPSLVSEAASYLATIALARVPWHRGAQFERIDPCDQALIVTWRDHKGHLASLAADHVSLHDGLAPNNFGLPAEARGGVKSSAGNPLVIRVGDCREALGAAAAVAGGEATGRNLAAHLLTGGEVIAAEATLARHRSAQHHIARAFAPRRGQELATQLPDDTVICRCEGRTLADLKKLVAESPGLSARELKLNGRFAMGACQGRFCASNAARLLGELSHSADQVPVSALTGQRWPLRPVSIAALAAAVADAPQPGSSTKDDKDIR
ncbi:FAD-dependent oxidoreductase [Pannonibacter carbonis]|uniref:FAD-dependent oxidoreductase n=1 Tax=Pannonibacter carbonis TaxID=2067569 RepID=UPI000D0FDC9B|nr:FAD-dependent oxidoreductase [Pannonibacter carbonis]